MLPRRCCPFLLTAFCGGWLSIVAIVARGEEPTPSPPSSAAMQAEADLLGNRKFESTSLQRRVAANHIVGPIVSGELFARGF
jgi:hypothetical protein